MGEGVVEEGEGLVAHDVGRVLAVVVDDVRSALAPERGVPVVVRLRVEQEIVVCSSIPVGQHRRVARLASRHGAD